MNAHEAAGQMMQWITAAWTSQTIYVAAKLGIADVLSGGPRTAEELAHLTKVDGPSLYRVLRALASIGVFAETPDGRFQMTPHAETLRSDVPGSKRALAIMFGEEHFRAWGDMLECVRTGQPAFQRLYGKPVFEYLADHPENGKLFDQAMESVHGEETDAMLEGYDFSTAKVVADVGGGNGSLMRKLLAKFPTVQGMLVDLPPVIERARPLMQAAGTLERCRLAAGDFFQAVPGGADIYLFRHIIHDWTDEQCRQILSNLRKSIAPTGKLLVAEMVIPPGNDRSFGKFLDLNMLVMAGGKERTEPEYRTLFEASGFRLTRVIPTRHEISLVEGVPA
jgi:hypothetical protein